MPNCRNIIKAGMTGDGVVGALERRFRELLRDAFHCLSVINATAGLAAVLRCLPPGKVITPLFTSPSTWAAIRHAGHEAEFLDIDPVNTCLSREAVSDYIANRRDVGHDLRAIVTVNIFGHMSDLAGLRQLAQQVGALLIVDAAQSLATCLINPEYLQLADVVVFSLGPNKWLGCADGGIIAVKSESLWQELVLSTQLVQRQMLDVPQAPVDFAHYNYRINPYSAKQALTALQNFNDRLVRVRAEQSAIARDLSGSHAVEPMPYYTNLIFEPLTGIPLRDHERYSFFNIPLMVPARLFEQRHLPETIRQFRYRKSLCRSQLSEAEISQGTA